MGFGYGKVILLGEHSVVHGKPALAAAIEYGVHAKAKRSPHNLLRIPKWELELSPDATSKDKLPQAFAALLSSYEQDVSLEIEADIAIPAGAGLGCSAALGVALAQAIDDALGIERSARSRAEIVLPWEKIFHGSPSGIDNTIAACGGVVLYHKEQGLEQIEMASPWQLVIAHSGETSSTEEMVANVARQYEAEPQRITKVFDAIESVVRNGTLALQNDEREAFGQLMDMNHSLLCSLMLCTTKLDALCARAREAGALGAKLTGAGGGGCMIALASSSASSNEISRALKDLSPEVFCVEVGL